MPDTYVADTSVISYLTRPEGTLAESYLGILGQARLAISFQTVAELLASDFAPRRRRFLDLALAEVIRLPHRDETSDWYAHVARSRRRLRSSRTLGAGAGDADVWIIASALQHRLPLVSHDRQQIALARAAGLDVYTTYPLLRAGNPK